MSLRVTGIKKALGALEDYKDTKTKQLETATQKATIDVDRNAKQNAPSDTGMSRSSIHRTSNKLNGTVSVNANYAPYVEFGTGSKVEIPAGLEDVASEFRGGGEGSFDDMIESLEAWANRKGIPQEAVYPIALKILREGVEAQPFLFPAWEKVRPEYIKEIKEILSRIR